MIELIAGAILAVVSLLIGYSLGKNQTVVSPDVKKQIQQIFRKVVPNPEVGPVTRPTQQQNFYRDNPRIAQEQDVMTDEIDNLNKEVGES